tara:strand:- start:35 stop:280 length:246 start_codon:yes stop_codon:yes gene_type:complete
MEYDAMSTYRVDVAELIAAQIIQALEKEYDRGWKECMEYYWSKREIPLEELESQIRQNDRIERAFGKEENPYDEDKDPYAG